ncbi:MAG: fimbrillin family protein [Rikenellaceae bacterium]
MKTKNKYLVALLALGVAVVGCMSEKVETGADESTISGTIGFSGYATISKGSPIVGNTDFSSASNDFGVTAYISSVSTSAYMGDASEGAQIVYDTDWDYADNSDSKYWPTTGETLNFYAYSPFDGSFRGGTLAVSSDDLVITDFTVPSDITSQEDFMYAYETDVTSSSSSVSSGELTLVFNHALTQINFEVSTAQTNLYVQIESIAVGNVSSVGDFSAVSGWSGQNTNEQYFASIIADTIIGNTAVDLTSSQDDILMLIPQTFTPWNGLDNVTDTLREGEGAYVLISCKLYNETDSQKTYLIGSEDSYAKTALPISSNDITWDAATKVTYSIVFAADNSTSGGGGYDPEGDDDDAVEMIYPITFTTSVNAWAASSGSLNM